MARRKDDKRVLRRGNGKDNSRKRRLPTQLRNKNNRNNHNNRNNRRQNYSRYDNKQKKPRSGKTVLIMILVLIAFIIGAGMGVLLSFDDGTPEKNETHFDNVTVEMTSNLNNTTDVVFEEADQVDYNENQSSEILGAEDQPYYDYSQVQPSY